MAKTIELNHLTCFFKAVFCIFSFQDCDNWRQFFTSKWLFFANFSTFSSQDVCSFRNCKSCLFCNPSRWFTDDIWIQFSACTVLACSFYAEAEFLKKGFFFFVYKVSFVRFEFSNKFVIDFFVDDNRLFRRTNHTVVK
ncbi:Uncharacterised protein [Chlamydia trachomatis]|nr:Uncharacterised protein [Chlamydia trachomatis]